MLGLEKEIAGLSHSEYQNHMSPYRVAGSSAKPRDVGGRGTNMNASR